MPQRTPHRVFIVEDNDALRRVLVEIIAYWPGLEVCGAAATLGEAYARMAACGPDLAVVDLRLPDGLGTDLVRCLTARDPGVRCILFTAFDTGATRREARRAGALECVVKGDPTLLHEALRRAMKSGHVGRAADGGSGPMRC